MKKLIYPALFLLVVAVLYGIYLFNKKPDDTRSLKADFEISSTDLVKEFVSNEVEASKIYVDRILVVTGRVTGVEIATASVFLDSSDPLSSVNCNFYVDESKSIATLKQGDLVKIKGKCTGKLMDVTLNNCSLISR